MIDCHTWVYKNINLMSDEEIQKEIDCVIQERSSRWYMKSTADEFVTRMTEMIKDSSVTMSYSMIKNRYTDARYENNIIIDNLKESKNNLDISLITEKNGFDTRDDNNYLFLCYDEPFKLINGEYIEDDFTDPDDLINYLYNIDINNIMYYNGEDYVYGMDEVLENKIRDFFKKHKDIIIEFG